MGDNALKVSSPGALSGAATRQAHAAEVLFTRYRDQIYRFCYARLRSREEAEDATQNVFMRVHMALKRGVVPEYEAAWLYKIAHNVCLSRGASTSRRASHETPHAFDEEDDVQLAAREVSHDELAGLSEALHAMPDNMRKAILLREWQGLSYAEIAEAMGLTVPAVETLLFRARRHLAAALEQGTPTPKKRRLGWFTLPTFLRRFLSAAAPAKLAAGAALVALTGGGLGLGVSVAHFSAPGPHASSPAASVPRVSFLSGVHAPAAAATRAAAARKQTHKAPAEIAAGSPAVIAAVAPSIVPAAPPVTARPEPPVAPASTPQPTGTTAASVAPAAPTVPAATTVPAVPTVQAPAAAPPDVTVPTVSTPSVDPTTVTSAVPLPSLPPVSVPVVTLP